MLKKSIVLICLLPFFLIGCSSNNYENEKESIKNNTLSSVRKNEFTSKTIMEKKIEKQFKNWRGVSYKIGGKNKSGIDCSGFVMEFFDKNLNFILPRTTSEQMKVGKKINNKNELKTGDLVFFRTGRGPTGNHVGIYYKNGLFLHVSSNEGVTYSSLSNSYWAGKYLFGKRVSVVMYNGDKNA